MIPGEPPEAPSGRRPGPELGWKPRAQPVIRWAGSLVGLALLLGLGACGRSETPTVDPELERLRAENALAQGRTDWARIHFANDYRQHPERLESLRDEGLAWLSGYQQSLSEGIERLDAYLALAGPDPEIERRVVATLLLLGEWEASRARLDNLGDGAEADRLRARALAELDLPAARQAVARAVEQEPKNAAGHALAARLADSAEDFEATQRHAEIAVALDPLDYSSHYLLGRLARRARDVAAARQALERHQWASHFQHDGTLAPPEPAEALELLDRLAESMPEAAPLLQRERLKPLLALGRLADAVTLVEGLVAADDTPVSELQDLAVQIGEAGRSRLSRSLFERILITDPGNRGAVASLIQLDLESGDLASASQRLTVALADDPSFARLHLLAARLARSEDRTDDALVSARRALDLAPWEAGWRVETADLLLALGLRDEARGLILAAPESTPVLDRFRQRHGALFAGSPPPGDSPPPADS